jgi:hypothetical protein
MILKRTLVICAAVCGVALTSAAHSQEGRWSVGLTGGTLGVGPEVSFRPHTHFGVRANAGFLSVSRDEDIDEIEYEGDVELNSFGAMLDWYPTGGGFRVSLGGRINNNEIELAGAPASSVTVGDTTYTPQQIGTLSGKVAGDDFTPTLSVGYGGQLARGFTVGVELGVMWQGEPKIDDLRATGLLASNPQFQADIDAEEQQIEDDLDDYELWPVLQIEFLYRF